MVILIKLCKIIYFANQKKLNIEALNLTKIKKKPKV